MFGQLENEQEREMRYVVMIYCDMYMSTYTIVHHTYIHLYNTYYNSIFTNELVLITDYYFLFIILRYHSDINHSSSTLYLYIYIFIYIIFHSICTLLFSQIFNYLYISYVTLLILVY